MFLARRCRTRLGYPIALAAVALATTAAAASAACPPAAPTSQPFAPWGDHANYVLAGGGAFEESLSWTAKGTPTLVAENDPFQLGGPGATSVRLRGRQAITSPILCESADHPYLRFVGRAQDWYSRLVLEVLWSDKGVYKEKVLEEHPADLWQRWAPSKVVPLSGALPTGSGEVHEIRLRFKLKDGVGDWLVDDLFIDPVRRG